MLHDTPIPRPDRNARNAVSSTMPQDARGSPWRRFHHVWLSPYPWCHERPPHGTLARCSPEHTARLDTAHMNMNHVSSRHATRPEATTPRIHTPHHMAARSVAHSPPTREPPVKWKHRAGGAGRGSAAGTLYIVYYRPHIYTQLLFS